MFLRNSNARARDEPVNSGVTGSSLNHHTRLPDAFIVILLQHIKQLHRLTFSSLFEYFKIFSAVTAHRGDRGRIQGGANRPTVGTRLSLVCLSVCPI